MRKSIRLLLIAFLSVSAGIAVFSFPPVPQDQNYHMFADQRTMLGIPNFLNVISNLPFFLFALIGLFVLQRQWQKEKQSSFVEKAAWLPYLLLFSALGLTGAGSIYYHLHPDNMSLLWDRLPMSIVFMSFCAAIIAERIDRTAGTISLFPLIILGIASVIYWEFTEIQGRGDLRPYIMVQYYPMVAIPAIICLFPSAYSGSKNLFGVFIFYGLSKICEALDAEIFSLGQVVSGHSMKHFASAVAVFWIIRMIYTRLSGSAGNKECAFGETTNNAIKKIIDKVLIYAGKVKNDELHKNYKQF
jgi:hypothetical protein